MSTINQIQAYVPAISLWHILPFLILLAGAISCLLFDAASSKARSRAVLPYITVTTLVATLFALSRDMFPSASQTFLEGAFRADEFGRIGSLAILFAGLMMAIFAPRMVIKRNLPAAETYALLLFAMFGAVALAMANEMLTAFIVLETMSLSLYVLAGIDRRSAKSTEAAFKYFILGAFASAFLVLGIAFLFGATHTTYINEMAQVFKNGGVTNAAGDFLALNPVWVFAGFSLVFVGICFKLSLAPFHMYAPDVYEGANTPTVLVIATASKVAAMAFFVHLLEAMAYWPTFAGPGGFIIGLVAVASMLWGNLGALAQSNFKRMMAYSSISHTGYMAVGALVLASLPAAVSAENLGAAQAAVRSALVLYLAGYTITSTLAFGLAYHLDGEGQMQAYRGLVYRRPVAAIGMALAMLSLVGIGFSPPTIGFMAKFYLFKEAVQHGFVLVSVIAVLASVVSAFYYLGLVVKMFMEEVDETQAVRLAGMRSDGATTAFEAVTPVVLVAVAVIVFALGMFPNVFLSISDPYVQVLVSK